MQKLSRINQPYGDLPQEVKQALLVWPLRIELKDSRGQWFTTWDAKRLDIYTYRAHPEDVCWAPDCNEPSVKRGEGCKCHREI